jgi:hypothetical protein
MEQRLAQTEVIVVERDESKWWAGTQYSVRFRMAESGWSTSQAATFVMDISHDEDLSPGSSSPWSGWVGWFDDEIIVTWTNPEVEAHGVTTIKEAIEVEEEPGHDQWEALARVVMTACLDSGEAEE